MTSDKFEIVKPDDYGKWDDFVKSSANGTVFQTTSWANIICDIFDYSFEIFKFSSSIELGCLLFKKKTPLGNFITQAPLTPYTGTIFKASTDLKPSSFQANLHKGLSVFIDYVKNNFSFITLNLHPKFIDNRPFLWQNFQSESRFTYHINLEDPKDIIRNFNQDIRKNIRNAERDNIKITASNDVNPLISFIFSSYKKSKLTPPVNEKQLRQFLKNCLKEKLASLYYMVKDDVLLAGQFTLQDERFVYTMFTGTNPENKQYQSSFLHYHIMTLPENKGKILDFLGANTESLEQYKRSYGGELVPYFNVYYYKNRFIQNLVRLKEYLNLYKRKI